MDPTSNILQMLESNTTTYQSTSYYLTCSGYNPLQYYISEANYYLDELNTGVTTLLTTYCQKNPYLILAQGDITRSKSLLVSMQTLLDCSTIRGYYDAIIEKGYCTDVFQGNYFFWLSFYVAGAALCFVPWFFWGFRLSQSDQSLVPQEDTLNNDAQLYEGGQFMDMSDIYGAGKDVKGKNAIPPIAVAIPSSGANSSATTSPRINNFKILVEEYNLE